MSIGVNGLQILRLADVKSELEAAYEDKFGVDNVDLSADGPIGQLIGIAAEREALLWELLETAFAANSETGASGATLDQLYLLVNLVRLQAAPTRTIASDGVTPTAQLTGTPATIVPAGFKLRTSDTDAEFELFEEVEIGGGGTVLAEFRSIELGPVQCLSGTLTVIPTPLAGLTAATNLQDALVGRLEERDDEFRARRTEAGAVVASTTSSALIARILTIADVVEARLIENRGDTPDTAGRPGHSFELLVRGGVDADIHEAIFERKPSGIETVGSTSGVVVDLHGDGQTVRFSRPTIVPVWVEVDLVVDAGFPIDGVAQVENAVLAYGQTSLRQGLTVAPFKIEQGIETPGIVELEMRIGLSANPTSTEPLEIAETAIAEFDSTRLLVERIN